MLTADKYAINSSDTSFTLYQVTLDASASTGANFLSYEYIQLSGPPAIIPTGSSATKVVYLSSGGTYTFAVISFDQCWHKNSSSISVTVTCDAALVAALTVSNATAEFSFDTFSYPTIQLDASTSTITNPARTSYRWYIITPSGVETLFAANTPTPSYNLLPIAEAGVYTFRLVLNDGCRQANASVTVTTLCPNALSSITQVGTTASTNGYAPALVTYYTTPPTLVEWTFIDSEGNTVYSAFAANATYSSTNSGTYTVTAQEQFCSSRKLNKTFTIDCSAVTTYTLLPSTSMWALNKFAPFTFVPAITGNDLGGGVYTVLSAPIGSIWAPKVETTVTFMNVSSDTTQMAIGQNLWMRNISATIRATNTTVIKRAYFSAAFKGQSAFIADIPGTYSVQLSLNGPCNNLVTSNIVTAIAQCNSAPVAKATYNATIANGHYYKYSFILSGLESMDADGDNLTYIWESTSNDTVFENNMLASTIVQFAVPGTYIIKLTVSDGCSNSTADLSIVVAACTSDIAIMDSQMSYTFDGFTPVSMNAFTLVGTERCNMQQNWELVGFVPAERVVPPPATTTGGESVSGAAKNVLSVACCLIVMIALLL